MIGDPTDSWVLVRLSTTTLWLPEADADELTVQVTQVRAVEPTEAVWEPRALVPADGWQGIQPRGAPRLASDVRFDTGRDVALIKLLPPAADVRRDEYEQQLARVGAVDHYIGVIDDIPGMATQTVRGRGGRRMGLHLDNWDRLPAKGRHASRNRVSLNLGPEPRWFIYVDLDVAAIHPPDEVPDTESARRLAEASSRPPLVVRLQVPPGWAYVAPTENLVHDVSTLGQRNGASHASALGRFTPTHGITAYTAVAVDADVSTTQSVAARRP